MCEPSAYPCPCCGYLVFDEEPGSYDICPVCNWEDDLSQLRFPTMGGANRPLIQCQQEYPRSRRSEKSDTSPEQLGFVRDPQWRPLDPENDRIEELRRGVDYGMTYADDSTVYYYWRSQR
jgi:hypothetical protein